MSKIQINADIDSTEITFEWSGKDIEKPLTELEVRLREEATALSSKLSPEARNSPIPTLTGLVAKNPEAEIKQKINLLLSDAHEARLWAQEARRTPEKVWRLTMSRLKWLHREAT